MGQEWAGYKDWALYTIDQIPEFLTKAIDEKADSVELVGSRIEYFNIPASFDIETSSFKKENGDKAAIMYIWQFGLNGSVIYGRTWGEFMTFCDLLVDYLSLNANERHLVVYVHNLGYEFQFIRKWFQWDKVFAIKQRRPVYAVTKGGIEFRCSLFLSNYSLAYLGDNLLHKYPEQKMVGDLDYSKIRHSETPLTETELKYCYQDVRVVMCYIQEKIEQDGDITMIPLTNTGYVRNYCREECFFENFRTKEEKKKALMQYRTLMKSLQIDDEEEYEQLHRAFMGGFTHANAMYVNQILDSEKVGLIGSADLTSSYPFTIVAEYFPMTKCEWIGSVNNEKIFESLLRDYCCVFDVKFINLRPRVDFENVLSESRCQCEGLKQVNNGRVVKASVCMTTLTELDYDTVSKFYVWDKKVVCNMRVYKRGYLPKPLILSVLKLYADKTQLKGVEGKEVEYLVSKNMINATFGMMVTSIIRDEFIYDGDWYKENANVTSQLAGYNKGFNRFLYYGWGVWVTAHARHNLFEAILEFGTDYVYSDTDSIKGLNFDKHSKFFDDYNNRVIGKLKKMCSHYSIDFDMCQPKTKEGESKLIGVWDQEDGYTKFKTCGAKRYIYMENKAPRKVITPELEEYWTTLNMTVAGLNKVHAIKYLLEEFDGDEELIMNYFGEGMFIPAGHTGKMTLSYLDKEDCGWVIDYKGKRIFWHERSSTYMGPQSYLMSLFHDYIKFLKGVQHLEL